MKTSVRLLGALAAISIVSSSFGQIVVTDTGYAQNFNAIGTSLPTSWTVRTGATTATLGTIAVLNTTATSWGDTGGSFKNLAAATAGSAASNTTQNSSSDRALGIKQTGSFGDPGAAFVFNFSSLGYNLTSLSIDAMMLTVSARSTTWTVDYGTGTTPTSFTSLTSYGDPAAFGTTSIVLSAGGLSALSNQSNVWLRITALSGSAGSGTRDTFAIDNFAITATSIPEPSTYAAIFGAVVLVGTAIHRRRQRAKAAV